MKGIRVVDMTSVLSGPFCTWLLSTLGAEVIKVESPNGDLSRLTPPFEQDVSLYFASLNRNKRSLSLDLKSESGQAALHRLLATADVFIENMRPGVRARLGCSDEDLERINPRLIRASISGFGQTGSLSSRPAYDIVVQAMSGMMSINGAKGGPATRVGFSTGDISAALFTTIGIIERLYQRDARGQTNSQTLDVSMLGCQWVSLENAFARYLNAGIVAEPLGSRHPSMTPFDVYPTADRDIVIALGSYLDWPRFCEAIGMPDLIEDERFKMDEARIEYSDTLDQILAQRLRTQPSAHWIELLLAQSIPCSVVENVESIANSSIADEYNAFSEVTTDDGASMKFVRNPIADPELQETAAPTVGQHSREILQELGYSEAEIAGFAGS
jgi:CoA:oxalate CoA-transferase